MQNGGAVEERGGAMLRVHASLHSPRTARLRVVALLIAAVAVLDSCADGTAPTMRSTTARAAPRGVAHEGVVAEPVSMRVCNQGATATYSTAAPLGDITSPVTLGDGHCAFIW